MPLMIVATGDGAPPDRTGDGVEPRTRLRKRCEARTPDASACTGSACKKHPTKHCVIEGEILFGLFVRGQGVSSDIRRSSKPKRPAP